MKVQITYYVPSGAEGAWRQALEDGDYIWVMELLDNVSMDKKGVKIIEEE